jgi:beta-fructofuranosidase
MSHLDPFFPARHPRPLSGWINDANGPIQVDGRYHLFFQYNPDAGTWGRIHWGHMESDDLVTWHPRGIAISPDASGPDTTGCWSGCAVATDDGVTLLYTGVQRVGDEWRQSVCLAHSSRQMDTWVKDPANPVVPGPPPDLDVVGFRDPYLWRSGTGYRLAMGSGVRGVGGVVFLYESGDLRTWRYLGPLLQGSSADDGTLWTGTMWECPQLLLFGETAVLLISVHDEGRLLYPAYSVGRLEGDRFVPRAFKRLDHGHDFYATAVTQDDAGRYLAWGWCWEGRRSSPEDRWAGLLTHPRILELDGDDRLRNLPAPELDALRGRHVGGTEIAIVQPEGSISPAEGSVVLAGAEGAVFDLEIEIAPGRAASVGVAVRCSPDGAERVAISWDRYRRELSLSRDAASLDPVATRGVVTCPHDPPDGVLRLRIMGDRSVLEVFTPDGISMTERIYPTRPDSTAITAFAYGGEARVTRFDWWDTSPTEPRKES